MMMMIE